jgi:RNA polymerase sigma factor for flagellar operon FliA
MGGYLVPDRRDAPESPSPEVTPDRDRLVRDNMGLVYDLARKLDRGDGSGPERSDLVSAGVIGLMQALDGFDPGRGLAFSTFAVARIRGAILDEIRRWDHAPRSVRQKQREIRRSEADLRSRLDRDPTPLEMADELSVSPEELHSWTLDVARHSIESLDATQHRRDGTRTEARVTSVIGDSGTGIVDRLGRAEAIELLKGRLQALPERERQVLALYYFEGLRLHQIADILGVTESRISQIRHKALRTLRSMLSLAGVEEP